MTIVSAPIDNERANLSKPSIDSCRCISRSPDSS